MFLSFTSQKMGNKCCHWSCNVCHIDELHFFWTGKPLFIFLCMYKCISMYVQSNLQPNLQSKLIVWVEEIVFLARQNVFVGGLSKTFGGSQYPQHGSLSIQ